MGDFFKYQAAGNDFIIMEEAGFTGNNAARICDRHFGIGADGVLLYSAGTNSDAKMRIINSDGSEALMCGNGIRCFARYLFEQKNITGDTLRIQTASGIIPCKIKTDNSVFKEASVELGKPSIMPDKNGSVISARQITVSGKAVAVYGINIGNPHLVVIGNNLNKNESEMAARDLQQTGFIGKTVNVEVLSSIDAARKSCDIIVNERGAGFTLGCGTGGGASLFALFLEKTAARNERWSLNFPGGIISYYINDAEAVILQGTAEFVFRGTI